MSDIIKEKKIILTDTNPDQFAWVTPDRSLQFAAALTNIIIGEEKEGISGEDILIRDSERLTSVLTVLKEYTPIKLATLWKLKGRARYASAIARTVEYDKILNPLDKKDQSEFVCPWDNSHIDLIIKKSISRREDRERNGNWPLVTIDNVADWQTDELFNTAERIKNLKLKKAIAIPFGSMCSPNNSDDDSANYLLNLYFSKYEEEVKDFIPRTVFDAVKSKLESGVCALIDRRLTRITNAISEVEMSKAGDGADRAMGLALEKVLPAFIPCEGVLRVIARSDDSYRAAFNKRIAEKTLVFSNSPITNLGKNGTRKLLTLIEQKFKEKDDSCQVDPRRKDTVILNGSEITKALKNRNCVLLRTILAGRIHNRAQPDDPRGFVILINRLNDMAIRKNSLARLPDYFDWEDEIYLNHICSILDFIAELFTAEEARLNRAHVIAHDLHAPTGFVYSTAERLRDWVDEKHEMPKGMVLREFRDILDTNDLQSALIDSLMLGLNTSATAPKQKYTPNVINLEQVAEDMARVVMPVCRKFRVPQTGIKIGSFVRPEIVMDLRAAKQIFLNIMTNAIKYSKKNASSDFSLLLYAEQVSLTNLETMDIPGEFSERMRKMKVNMGILLTFQDNGIGVPQSFKNRIFQVGSRADIDEVMSVAGAGIGLSVVKSIVNDHFGEVWLQNDGNPTTFCIFLPDFLRTREYTKFDEWQGNTR